MNNYFTEIQNRLQAVVEKEKRKAGLEKILFFLTIFASALLFLVIIESIGKFFPLIRTIFFYSFVLGFTLFAIIYLVIPFIKNYYDYKKHNYVSTAKIIGEKFPQIKDELANAIQLLEEKNSAYSNSLIDAAFKSVYDKSTSLDFGSIVDFSKTKKIAKICLSVCLFTFLIIFTVPGLSYSAYRLLNYNKNFAAPPKFTFEITPGNKEITKGEDVLIRIRVAGEKPNEIILSSKNEEQSEFETKKLFADSLGTYSYRISSLKSSFEYFAFADGITSQIYKITVVNRPVISSLDLEIIPPAYSKLPVVNQRDNGNVSVLPGSKIRISVEATKILSDAVINFSDSAEIKMQLSGNKAFADLNVMKDVDYKILIKDQQNISNVNPILYSIKLLSDAFPEIELISPKEDVKLGTQNSVSLISKISDDYGFSKMNLNYRLSSSKYRTPEQNFSQLSVSISKDKKEDEVYYTWNLSPLYLAEGEAIVFYLEVFDNDNVRGPKSARTNELSIVVPSINDIFQTAEKDQDNSIKELSETLKEAEKLQQEMKRISDDLKQNKRELTWQEKEKIEKASEKFEKIEDKLADISKKLADVQKDLMQNNLLSKETMEKYNELQNLMDQFNSEELKNALKKLQEALKGMLRENVQMSLEEMKANEEMLKNSIERTLNLLKRIQVEQKVDELIKRTENLTKKLEELKSNTENKNLNETSNRDELSQRQKDVSDNLDQLNKEINDLQKRINDLTDMPKEAMEKTKQEFDKQNNEELSKETQKFLQQMQKQSAIQNQQKLSSNMNRMTQQFKQLLEQLQQMNQMKTFYGLVKSLDDLLTLSKEQEKLKNKTSQINSQSYELNKTTQQQNELQNNLSRILQNINSLSQKSFSITPEMGSSLGKAFSQMQQAQTALQNQNLRLAENMQTNAMKYLNETATMLKNSMDQMMNGGQGGSGMISMMQQLQQMAQQQMSLNQMTQSLKNGQMTQQMMAQMQRLAQQQEMIRKSLEQLNREAKQTGQSKKIPANLDKTLDEMKEVITNLQSEKVDDNLVKLQEKILSKLLDAQRSINERDYEKDRKSNTGKNTTRTSPPELILTTEEGKNKLRDELQKAIKGGYKKDYEDLIRKYFESLEKLHK